MKALLMAVTAAAVLAVGACRPAGTFGVDGENGACGNGVIDPGETCDPPSSCPAGCDDSNACTQDALEGSARSCDARCSHAPITSCRAGDGCCPEGCSPATDADCSTTCGNGTIEAGETCDPPAACPASCDDDDPCTGDTLTGSPSNCSAQCSSSPVTACAGGDGCCPAGCDDATDTDCSDSCGNGVVDPGETCDPPASCPASCDDADPCTTDSLTGSAATCSARCTHAPVTACAGGDGCCPAGCDDAADADCSDACGNGVVDPGETCDPPATCPATCDDGNVCTADTLAGSATTCTAACSAAPITACAGGDGCCPASCDSTGDGDCLPGGCGNGVVDPGETCDPPASCPTSCNDGNVCTTDTLNGSAAACTAACQATPITACSGGDGCCPSGCSPATDADCTGGVSTELCGAGRVMVNGACADHAPSARGQPEVCAQHNSMYPETATWVWNPDDGTECDLGVYNDVAGQDATRRLNLYRWLAGARSLDHMAATQADLECATMMRENGLSHTPPTSWTCYTSAGAGVAGRANLSSASTPLGQLASYVGEGPTPYAFAHRRHLLGGNNDVSWSNTGGAGCNQLYWGTGGSGPDAWYAWPPAGYAPEETSVSWWQLSSDIDFPDGFVLTVKNLSTGSDLSVTVQDLGSEWNLTDGMYTLGFSPSGATIPGSYQVTVTRSDGTPLYQYTVAFVSC